MSNRFGYTQGRTRISWAEAKRLGAANGACGEIKSEEDVQRMPRGIVLRAVYIPAENAIRWANSNVRGVLSGQNHDHLYCVGDPHMPSTQGYIIVGSDGSVRVTDKHGR